MEFNKCPQCGSFFSTMGKVCPNCATKDNSKIQKLENYLQNNLTPDSIEELSVNTGIPTKDLNRFINETKQFSNLNIL